MKSLSTDAKEGAATPEGRPRRHRPTVTLRHLPFGPLGRFIPPLGTAVLRSVGRTCRLVEVRNEEFTRTRLLGERKNAIFAIWHNRMFYPYWFFAKRYYNYGAKFSLLVSASRDGELIARVITYMGGDVVRGSSSRGGREALYDLLGRLGQGYNVWATPDGPRGPRYVAHFGVVALAQKTGLPLIPVTCGIRNPLTFNSWDRFMAPWPFSQVRMLFGSPLYVPGNADEGTREYFRQKLQDDLNALTGDADDWRTVKR